MKAILTYHSIDTSGSPISVSPEAWDDHLRWFASGRVRVLDVDALLAHPHDASDAVAITFDDGFLSTRDALLALRQQGLPATVFVVTQHAGGTNAWGGRDQPGIPTLPLLDWTDLEKLHAAGVRLEAHTRTHPPLTTCTVEAAQMDAELDGCRDDLRERLGVTALHLAYPYGDISDAVTARAARSFKAGHTTEFQLIAASDDAMRLPRLDMYYFGRPGALAEWGTPAFLRRITWVRLRRAIRARLRMTSLSR